MQLLLFGILLSLFGSLPPGFISLMVAYTAIQKGRNAALWAALGASIVEFGQAWLASKAAMWLLEHPSVVLGFQWGAMLVFLSIGCYLLAYSPVSKAPNTQISEVSAFRQIGAGALVSLFNLLALPYWFAYCGWLKVNGWWPDNHYSILFFATGVGIGTFICLSLYAQAAQLMVARSERISLIANRVVGITFLVLALKTMLDLFG